MLLTWAVQRVSSPRGQGLVEYSLILVLVAIVVIAALMMLGPVVGNTFSTINNSLGSLPNP
jgi:pilus assembly protein Flp/PilA